MITGLRAQCKVRVLYAPYDLMCDARWSLCRKMMLGVEIWGRERAAEKSSQYSFVKRFTKIRYVFF